MLKSLQLIIISFLFCPIISIGQANTKTTYKNLKSKKFYQVQLVSKTQNGKTIYMVNEKRVNKQTFNKYSKKWDNINDCTPCILKRYDINEVLLYEGIFYTDAAVGWFNDYYPNGALKTTGYYKENPTGDWSNLCNRGYCSIKTGEWTYFDKNGDTLYSEIWDDGIFIKQVPEQDSVEVWDIGFYLNDVKIENQLIDFDQIDQLKIHAQYKNSAIDTNFRITARTSIIGYVPKESTFNTTTFNTENITKMFDAMDAPHDKRTKLWVTFRLGENYVGQVELNFK